MVRDLLAIKRLKSSLFFLVILVDLVSLNAHQFLPVSDFEVCYDANADRFFNLTQSLMIAGLILVIALHSNGFTASLSWLWFGFSVGHLADEVLFENQGGVGLEWLAFLLVIVFESVRRINKKA